MITQKQVRAQLPTSAVNVTLLAFAAERRAAAPLLVGVRRLPRPAPPLSIDISGLHDAQQQSHRTPRLRSDFGTDRQTDGRTHDRFIDPAQHTTRAVSIQNRRLYERGRAQ